MSGSGAAEVSLVRGLTPEVLEGLRLYRDRTAPHVTDAILQRDWTRWIQGSDDGPALSALARVGGCVVGFYSLLPVRMRLGGASVPGAKGEFLAVAPEYLRGRDTGSGMPVPFALVALAKRHAPEHGILASFGKTTKGAFITQATGGRPVEFAHADYVSLFAPRDRPFTPRERAREYAALAACRVLRAAGALRRPWISAEGAAEVPTFLPEHVRGDAGANYLVEPTAATLNYRFPAERYRKFVVEGAGGVHAHFVFSRPQRGAAAQLMDWATLEVGRAPLRWMLHRMLDDCRAAGAGLLHLPVPLTEAAGATWLVTEGFVRRQRDGVVYVTCSAPELARGRDEGAWRFTNAHASFYDTGGMAAAEDGA